MPHVNTLADECQRMKTAGKDNEALLAYLRSRGCSKVDSVKVMASVLNVGLGEAKKIVHSSRAWKDVRRRDEQFHDQLEETVKKSE